MVGMIADWWKGNAAKELGGESDKAGDREAELERHSCELDTSRRQGESRREAIHRIVVGAVSRKRSAGATGFTTTRRSRTASPIPLRRPARSATYPEARRS